MSINQTHKRKRLRKDRITYGKRKQKLIDGKIIEQFYEVGSETDVSIDCPLFELPQSLAAPQVEETAFQKDFLPKLCLPQLLTSKDVVSRMGQLNFVGIKSVTEKVESENEDPCFIREDESVGFKCSKRKRTKANKRKAVSDSLLAPSDSDSNDELGIETSASSTPLHSHTETRLYATASSSHAHPQAQALGREASTHLDADDEESCFETVISDRHLSHDVEMKDLSVQLKNKGKRNLLRDPELVNSIITQFVESTQNQLAIPTRIDKFGFRIIRCLSLAHGVKVKLLEHCHFGWCPLLARTARTSVRDKVLLEPMLNLLREESRQINRRQKSRKSLLPDPAPSISTQ